MGLEAMLTEWVESSLKELFEVEVNPKMIQIQKTRREFDGDFTLVVFPFLKMSKKSPEQTGEMIGTLLCEKADFLSGFNVVKGFLNLEVADGWWVNWLNDLSEPQDRLPAPGSGETKMVEYSSPNTNKPLHLGHIRNILLGYSVSELLKANGHKVIKTQIINDKGIHICKSMLAWQKFGNGETPQSSGLKGDKLVGKYYVEFDKRYKQEVKERTSAAKEAHSQLAEIEDLGAWIKEQGKLSKEEGYSDEAKQLFAEARQLVERAEKEAPLMLETQEMLRKWEAKDPEVVELWKTMNGWVYDGFDQTYNRLKVDFDQLYYESDTYIFGKKKVLEGLEKGIFYQKEDGSIWCDLTQEGLDHKLLLRSDGTSVYMTQDIGTALMRIEDVPELSQLIYTVGNEQDYHFQVLFMILGKLGYEWAQNCYHLSYGMVDLPSGKMKSREGTVVDADDLMEEMYLKAKETTLELGKLDNLSEEGQEELFNQIGLAALKYFILKVDPKRRMMFNPEESVQINGNTGPFIQYGYARTQAIKRRAEQENLVPGTLSELDPSETALIRQLYFFEEVIREAGDQYSPAVVANYVYDLVKLYNVFYHACPFFNEENDAKKAFRINLSEKTGQTIGFCLNLLGIGAPERM
ncbi:arginine--tRNA ligase [bacterium SCSIO 12741]|nr:arginine--tRNA ligase [bacterium SCSIO 12741]